jgi:hypothetical protein
MKIDLPEPLNNLTIPGKVNQGELTITKYEPLLIGSLHVANT